MGLIKIIGFWTTFDNTSNVAIRFFIGDFVETLSSINHIFQLSWSVQLLSQAKRVVRKKNRKSRKRFLNHFLSKYTL